MSFSAFSSAPLMSPLTLLTRASMIEFRGWIGSQLGIPQIEKRKRRRAVGIWKMCVYVCVYVYVCVWINAYTHTHAGAGKWCEGGICRERLCWDDEVEDDSTKIDRHLINITENGAPLVYVVLTNQYNTRGASILLFFFFFLVKIHLAFLNILSRIASQFGKSEKV